MKTLTKIWSGQLTRAILHEKLKEQIKSLYNNYNNDNNNNNIFTEKRWQFPSDGYQWVITKNTKH